MYLVKRIYRIMTPQAMRSPAAGRIAFQVIGFGMDHQRRTAIGKNGISGPRPEMIFSIASKSAQ